MKVFPTKYSTKGVGLFFIIGCLGALVFYKFVSKDLGSSTLLAFSSIALFIQGYAFTKWFNGYMNDFWSCFNFDKFTLYRTKTKEV